VKLVLVTSSGLFRGTISNFLELSRDITDNFLRTIHGYY
jgi:hypothetical protein